MRENTEFVVKKAVEPSAVDSPAGCTEHACHGYERSHKDGVRNTLKLPRGYLL